jgi:uncharacterized protein (TIGR00369 family)
MRADRFEALDPALHETWGTFLKWSDRRYFPQLVGLEVEEIRTDYCRMRLPYRPELDQPAGVVHGGAIATLIDTVVVPAIGQAYEVGRVYLTIGMNVSYLGAVIQEDAIAEGWIEQRGRSIVFCAAEVTTASGKPAATGTLTYKVGRPTTPG